MNTFPLKILNVSDQVAIDTELEKKLSDST